MPIDKQYILKGLAIAVFVAVCLITICYCVLRHIQKVSEMKRRNVPQDIKNRAMTTIVEIISRAAQASGTKPFLVYGTLLGYQRQKDFICYDFDVDTGVVESEFNQLKLVLGEIIKEYPGYSISDKPILGFSSLKIFHNQTGINGDIFKYIKKGDAYKRDTLDIYAKYIFKERVLRYDASWIDTPQEITFKGYKIYIPNQPHEMLKAAYGSNYITPDHRCDDMCGNCVKV